MGNCCANERDSTKDALGLALDETVNLTKSNKDES